MDKSHGSPYDRGVMDSYYRRRENPHKWLDDLGAQRVDDLTETERAEYQKGYNDNEKATDFKDYE